MTTKSASEQTIGGADAVLLQGDFDTKLKTYLLMQALVPLVVSIAGIVLLVFTPIIIWVINKQYEALSLEMTEKFLKVRKGIFVKTEKNVPLEQITDLGIVEGPVMRYLGIKQLSVETAGQSSTGPLVKLLGVIEAEAFRDKVLQQRDKLRKTVQTDTSLEAASDDATQQQILATLVRIEALLKAQKTAQGD